MTEIEFHCPQCQAHLIVEQQFFGKEINCPHCQSKIKVPSVRFPNGATPVISGVAEWEADQKRLQKELDRFYNHRRKRRQNQRQRIKTLLADAVLVQKNNGQEILFPCLHCDEELLAPLAYHGYDIYCPNCGELVEVPDDEDVEFGTNRVSKNVQDESFVADRPFKTVGQDNVAYPGDWEWAQKNRMLDHLTTPALLSTGAPHLRPPQAMENQAGPGYNSSISPDGSMMINITLNPDESTGSRPVRSIGPSTRKNPVRPGGGALKTPVKDVKELQVTGAGGRTPQRDLEGLWGLELRTRHWEKIIGLGVVAAFLITMTVLGIIFLTRADRSDRPDSASESPSPEMQQTLGSSANEFDHQEITLSPEEVEEAKYVIRNYLGSDSWRERLGYVRNPEKVRLMMEEYYRDNSDGPIRYNSMELSKAVTVKGVNLLLVNVIDSEFREMFFTLEKTGGTYKIDWEVLVQYNPLSWKELKQLQPTEPLPFRVNLKVDNYYNFEFTDRSVYQCFRISNRQEFTGLYAYVRKSAPFFEKINIEPNQEKMVIVELAYPTNPQSRNLVEIVGFVQDGWLTLDEPVEEISTADASTAESGAPTPVSDETAPPPVSISTQPPEEPVEQVAD